jgi:hypothetical protein
MRQSPSKSTTRSGSRRKLYVLVGILGVALLIAGAALVGGEGLGRLLSGSPSPQADFITDSGDDTVVVTLQSASNVERIVATDSEAAIPMTVNDRLAVYWSAPSQVGVRLRIPREQISGDRLVFRVVPESVTTLDETTTTQREGWAVLETRRV